MRKIFTLLAVFVCALAQAQTPFITPVTYRGAFAPSPTAQWTDGWTNWSPDSTNYGNGVGDSVINTNITSNRRLSSSKKYVLSGLIYVTNNATITIPAGTILKGDAAVANSSLVITRGAKINAIGTATRPIVFTTTLPVGSRSKGDWGGVILLGKAHYNGANGENYIEGIAPTSNAQYGGGFTPDDNDSSGVMQYCRIEFGGYIFAPNQEINGLTFGAIGRKTVIDHIQVSYSNDDSYEWFGGSVNCKYLVAYRGLDDNWDTDNGFSGAVQFCLGIRDPNISDNPAISTSEGFESDNDAAGSNRKPFTTALFSNITDIGPLRGNVNSTIALGFRRSVRIRRNSHLRILNSVLLDFPTGVLIDGAACTALANGPVVSSAVNNSPGNLIFKNNILAGNKIGKVIETNTVWDPYTWFGANHNDSIISTSGILVNPYSFTAGDYRPATGSPALLNYNFNDSAFYYVDSTGALSTLIACPITPSIGGVKGNTVACTYIASQDTARLYLTKKSNGILRYEWTVPTGVTIISGQYSDTLIIKYPTNYNGGYFYVKGLTYCGAYSTNQLFYSAKGAPSTPGVISGPSFACDYLGNGDTATYSVATVLYATSYNWVVPANVAIVAGAGTNTIKVLFSSAFTSGSITVQALAVCGNSNLRTLVVSKTAAAPGTISGPVATCGLLNTPQTYSIAPVANATSYVWKLPVGAVFNGDSTGSTISVTYPTARSSTGPLTVKSVSTCGLSAEKLLYIFIVATPTKITGPASVCANDVATYTAFDTLNSPGTTYTWTLPSGLSFATGQGTKTISVNVDPSFLSGNISVKAQNCSTNVSNLRTLAVALNPGCKMNSFIAKGVTDAAITTFSVFPNPNKGNFAVYFDSKSKAGKATIQILNSFGQVVSQRTIAVSNGLVNEKISESKLAPGMYIVKCMIGSETKTSKVIVE